MLVDAWRLTANSSVTFSLPAKQLEEQSRGGLKCIDDDGHFRLRIYGI